MIRKLLCKTGLHNWGEVVDEFMIKEGHSLKLFDYEEHCIEEYLEEFIPLAIFKVQIINENNCKYCSKQK